MSSVSASGGWQTLRSGLLPYVMPDRRPKTSAPALLRTRAYAMGLVGLFQGPINSSCGIVRGALPTGTLLARFQARLALCNSRAIAAEFLPFYLAHGTPSKSS